MSDLTPETVTDAQVDEFFKNEGSFEDKQSEVVETPSDKAEPEEKDKQPEIVKEPEEKKVNLGALHEERSRRKAEAERAAKAEQRAIELERQLQQYTKPQEPNIDDDPVEAMKRKTAQMEQILIAQAKQAKAAQENNEYWGRVKESELAYKQEHPDFDDAVKFLADTRLEELQDLGWSKEEAAQVLADEVKWISDKAYADEVNPAERFHNLAKRRGWKAKEEPKDTTADDKLANIQKGMEKNRALPPASKSVKQDLTAEALADMNVDALSGLRAQTDFDKAWAKLFGNA